MCALQVVIDFGQELVTSVHRPVKWSNERPAEDEFRAVFASTRISAQRILQFVGQRQHVVQRLVLLNSEGYWSGAGPTGRCVVVITSQFKPNTEADVGRVVCR